jgi:competence protein ComFC
MKDLLSAALDLVYPRLCGACGRTVGEDERHVCWDCLARLEILTPPFCSRCGDPVDGAVDGPFVCAWCRSSAPHFELARSAARHRGPLKALIHGFKYLQATHVEGDLAMLLVACVRTHYPKVPFDAVTFVPLHPARERERSYNQAHLLARRLAGHLGLPLMPRGLRRIRATGTQTHLKAHERRTNVRGAFAAVDAAWTEGRRLLLVDDVMTTGATVDEVSRVLKEAGAAGVYVVTVARG